MFRHVARFTLPLPGGDSSAALGTIVVFVTEHTIGATHGGELLVFDRTPFQPRGRWPYADAVRRKVPALEQQRLDPVAILPGGRMLFLLSGYQDRHPSFLAIPIVFDPSRTPAFLTLTRRWSMPFPLGRVTARRFHDLPDGTLALTTETRVSSLFHVETDATVDGTCVLDITRGSIRDLDALPHAALPHDSGHFYALGFGISISDEHLFGPPPWGSGADVEIKDGTITVTPTDSGKPLAHLTLCGPCANPCLDPQSAKRRVRAGRHGPSLLVLDGTASDQLVVDLWQLPHCDRAGPSGAREPPG